MTEPESIRSKNALLVSPNLGHPLFLQIDPKLKNTEFELKLLFVSNIDNLAQFKEYIKDYLLLTPILEYKWKLLESLEKEKRKRLLKLEEEKRRLDLISRNIESDRIYKLDLNKLSAFGFEDIEISK